MTAHHRGEGRELQRPACRAPPCARMMRRIRLCITFAGYFPSIWCEFFGFLYFMVRFSYRRRISNLANPQTDEASVTRPGESGGAHSIQHSPGHGVLGGRQHSGLSRALQRLQLSAVLLWSAGLLRMDLWCARFSGGCETSPIASEALTLAPAAVWTPPGPPLGPVASLPQLNSISKQESTQTTGDRMRAIETPSDANITPGSFNRR